MDSARSTQPPAPFHPPPQKSDNGLSPALRTIAYDAPACAVHNHKKPSCSTPLHYKSPKSPADLSDWLDALASPRLKNAPRPFQSFFPRTSRGHEAQISDRSRARINSGFSHPLAYNQPPP